MSETLAIPVDTIWMKSPMIPDGSEKGHDLPSTRKLKTKVKTQPEAPVQYVQTIAAPVEVASKPIVLRQKNLPNEVDDNEIPSIQYTAPQPTGPSKKELQLEAENARMRAQLAAVQARTVSRAPPPSPEESEEDIAKEPPQKRDVGTSKTRSKREPKEESWFDKIPTWGKVVGALSIGLLLKGSVGAPAAAAVAKPAGGLNPWY